MASSANTTDRQHYALQTIFSFFLGLMVVAFIGVGVNTFYPSPTETYQQEQQELSRQMEALNFKQPTNGSSVDATVQAQIAALQVKQNALQDKVDALMKGWARNTSIILVIFATLVMGVSLIRSEQLRVISNGLLLGGLFSMIYGAGWVIFSGNSVARFAVILFALVVAIGLGYLKFVRNRETQTVPVASGGSTAGVAFDDAALAGLAERVTALEDRAAAAAAALSGGDDERRD
ncbi:MAG: hypothetical protein HGB10_02060 [Coriobacteriia bacterium]|nr:hypothetical protein [Coriobacteriia bacterium]